MGYYCRLQHGSKYRDLTTGAYRVEQSWRPPGASVTALFGGGTMRSPYAGGEFIDERYEDRDINLPLQVRGDTAAETHQAVRALGAFIKSALADRSEKLYLVYGPSDAIPYTPKYGQQFYKYEIKALLGGDIGGRYGIAEVRSKLIELSIPLRVAPFAVGEQQLVGSATGGILEHSYATPDGRSRGLSIPIGTTNKFDNPIFGNATYDTDYSVSNAALLKSQVTDKKFVFAGANSCELINTSASAQTLYQSIAAGNTNAHTVFAIVKRRDGAAVTSSDCQIFYNAVKTSVYTHIGDSWYLVWWTGAGIAAATNTGLTMAAKRSLIVGAFQMEEKGYPTQLCYGDQLDCSWSGTAHATSSTSTRTAARWRTAWSNIGNAAEGSLYFAVTMHLAYNKYTANQWICETEDSNFRIYWSQSNNLFVFSDGTTTLTLSAGTFAAHAHFYIYVTWTNTTMTMTINGSSDSDTYTLPSAAPDLFYIGCTNAAGSQGVYTIHDFLSFTKAISAAEIAAHYASVSQHIGGGDGLGQALNPIPWLWTDDGDDTLDNNTDSTHENWAIIGGVPGNVQARSSWIFATDSFDVRLWILMSSFPWEFLRDHDDLFYIEASGTVDAGASGGAHYDIATPTALPRNSISITVPNPEVINGTVHFFVRAKHQTTAGNVSVGRFISYVNGYIQDVDKTIAVTTTYKWFYIGNLRFLDNPEMRALTNVIPSLNFGSAIAASNLWIDFGEAFCGDMLTVDPISTDIPGGGGSATAPTNVFITEKQARFENGTYTPDLNGDIISVNPNRANMLVLYKANDAGDHSLSSYFGVTLNITPRWLLV